MITTDTTRMRSPHSASTHCTVRLVDPALTCGGVATFMKQSSAQFGDRTPTTGPPRGASG